MKNKLDIILPNLAIGGAEKVMLILAREFKKKGFEVRFIVRQLTEKGFQNEVEKDFELINLKCKKIRKLPFALSKKYKTIIKPNIILVSLWPLTFLTSLVSYFTLKKCKVICIEHGSLKNQLKNKGKFKQFILKQTLQLTVKFCYKMVCVSNGLKKEIQQIIKTKTKKIIAIPNPIPIEKNHEDISISIKSKLKGAVFLFVGRLKKVKNIPLLLEAFSIVNKKIDSTLLIVGNGTELDNLKKIATNLQIKEQVHFLGFIKNCTPYYKIANTFVLSSDAEGFGNVIVEALAEGCTVVSTNCPYGPKEILDNGKYGYLAEVKNEEDLANKMLKSVESPFLKTLLKERASSYLPTSISQQYLAVFNSI